MSFDFFSAIIRQAPSAKEIHIILDDLSAHKTQAEDDFLGAHPLRPRARDPARRRAVNMEIRKTTRNRCEKAALFPIVADELETDTRPLTVFRRDHRHCRRIDSGRLAASRNALFYTRLSMCPPN